MVETRSGSKRHGRNLVKPFTAVLNPKAHIGDNAPHHAGAKYVESMKMTELMKINQPARPQVTHAGGEPDLISARPALWQRLRRRLSIMCAAWQTQRALERLDDHLLEDIGIDPAERALYRQRKQPVTDFWISRF